MVSLPIQNRNSPICESRPSQIASRARRYSILALTSFGTWLLIACRMCNATLAVVSIYSFSEAYLLTLLVSFQIAMSQTSALCKPIATASSASNCCKCMVNRIMVLPCCLLQKRIRNGNYLRLQPRIGQTRNGSSPQKKLHLLLSPERQYQTTHSVIDLDVTVEGPPSLTHTPSAFTSIKRRVSLLRPASWPRRLTPLLARSLQAPLP